MRPHGTEETTAPARWALLRGALIYTPLALASDAGVIAVIVLLIQGGDAGLYVTLVVAGLIGVLTSYQSIQSVRDLASEPRLTTGWIRRKWSRSDFIVSRSHYIYVDKSVFKVDPATFVEVEEGDSVSILHYPHTNTVVSVGPGESKS